MTEAIAHTFTPFLLYLSAQTDVEEAVLAELRSKFEKDDNEEIIWVNPENEPLSIETVRNLQQTLSYGSYQGAIRHVILKNIENSSPAAQNALLKLLEEPPAHTQFWLTTQGGAILPTIISRCQEVLSSRQDHKDFSRETEDLAQSLSRKSHRELIDLAEKYSDRAQAEALINELILFAHQQLPQDTARYGRVLKLALQTQHYLAANVNVRLVLENYFFLTKQILSN